ISPLSNTAAIFVSGFSTASFSFLASNRGLYTDFFLSESVLLALICASHIFSLASGSGNWGSSGSTTMCFFSRVQPLSLLLRPFGFWAAFCSLDEGDFSAFAFGLLASLFSFKGMLTAVVPFERLGAACFVSNSQFSCMFSVLEIVVERHSIAILSVNKPSLSVMACGCTLSTAEFLSLLASVLI
uniref:Uncharacterized protein n=1 Tax=Pundamilia nyererei TaxID=303518 RepID=A0A3B4GTQ3_9CICH